MDHSAHEPGTVEGCPECLALSYEPSWYKAMRDERVLGRGPVVIPEADEIDVDVGLPVPPEAEVVLPDLENVRREDEER